LELKDRFSLQKLENTKNPGYVSYKFGPLVAAESSKLVEI